MKILLMVVALCAPACVASDTCDGQDKADMPSGRVPPACIQGKTFTMDKYTSEPYEAACIIFRKIRQVGNKMVKWIKKEVRPEPTKVATK